MTRRIFQPAFSMLHRYPSIAAGTCTFALGFALVAGNAFLSQSGNHPDPLWSTRDHVVTRSVSRNKPPVKSVRTSVHKPKAAPVPLSRNTAMMSDHKPQSQRSQLVADIQKALIATGDFSGRVDGLNGPVTRSAIRSYQERNGLKATGDASEKLLAALQSNAPKKVTASRNDALFDLIKQNSGPGSQAFDSSLVKKIQKGLAKSGVADVNVDGIFGNQTSAAIAEFQRKFRLKVTGQPDEEVLNKLIALGMLGQG